MVSSHHGDPGSPSEPRWGDVAAAAVLLVLQGLFAWLVVLGSALMSMSYGACYGDDDPCDYALGTLANELVLGGGIVFFVIALVVSIVRWWRGRLSWWVPLLGMAATACLLVVSGILIEIGTADAP
ncbi:hypothetical protein [Marisediminicola sp. LYQ134]|uniref:hypothetical protein n=1 Tax=unclassified Marisediminicola TaxID=2618316 RepID=UPI0039838F93